MVQRRVRLGEQSLLEREVVILMDEADIFNIVDAIQLTSPTCSRSAQNLESIGYIKIAQNLPAL